MKRSLVLPLGLVLALTLAPVPAHAQDATIVDDGWWNSVHDYSFVTDLLDGPPPVGLPPPPTNIPDDGLATGHTGTEMDKLAGILVFLDAPLGSTLVSAELVLPEHPEPGLSFGTGTVSACAATTPWGGTRNGEWDRRPEFDCETSSEGVRGDDGRWTFDIASIAEGWLDGTLFVDGIVFVITETVEPTQVVFQDTASPDVELTLQTVPAQPEEAEMPPVAVGAPVQPPPVLPAPAPEPPPAAEPPPAILEVTTTQAQPERIIDPDVFGNLPWATVLLVPLLLGGAGVVSYVLGPAGAPDLRSARTGAVSRALGGGQAAAPPVATTRRLGAVGRTMEETS